MDRTGTITGILHQVYSQKSVWSKVVWASVFLACVFGTVFVIFDRIQCYFDYPVSSQYQFIKSYDYHFPSFSICPSVQFDKETMQQNIANHNFTTIKDFNSVFDLLPNVSLDIIWENAAPKLTDVLLSCFFSGKTQNSCFPQSYWKTQKTVQGICHTLTITEKTYYHKHVIVLIRFNDSWCAAAQNAAIKYKFFIHASDEDLTYKVLTDGQDLIPGALSTVYYSTVVHMYKNSTKKRCVAQSDRTDCINRCTDLMILKNSKCKLPFMETLDLPLCTLKEEVEAIYSPDEFAHESEATDKCKCHRRCQHNDYKKFIDFSKTNESDVGKIIFLPVNKGEEVLSQNFLYPFPKLVCDVGAVLGLLVGISVLRLVEIVDVIISYLYFKLNR